MIEIENLSKSYGGFLALDQLNLSIDDGDIFGYIGPNGAGKSTTFKILATLLSADQGHAVINGYSVSSQAAKVRRLIGYMPDAFGAYEDMSVEDYLAFFAALYDIPPKDRPAVVDGVLDLTELRGKRKAEVLTLSRGMQQRLGLARVLLHDPKVLLLDEPASGLDPRARIEIRELLRELKIMGKTILISSHILKELAEIATKVGIIERGRLLFSGTVNELVRKVEHKPGVRLRLRDRLPEALAYLRTADKVDSAALEGDELVAELAPGADPADLIAALVERGFAIRSAAERELDLEQSFMQLTKGQVG